MPEKKTRRKSVAKKVPHKVSKKPGQRQQVKRRSSEAIRSVGFPNENDPSDRGYIFCSDKSLNKCWTGVELSEILQEESLQELQVKINLWAWRHIIIGIAKAHLEEIAPFFDKDEKACKALLARNIYSSIFPWLAGHQWTTNVSVYGLDVAFPGHIQPALLRFYRQISKIWHYWLGVLKSEEETMEKMRIIKAVKRALGLDENEEEEDDLPIPKRRKVIDAQTQTSLKKLATLEVKADDSPVTKKLIEEVRRMSEAVELRRRSRNLLNEFGTSG